MVLFGLCLLLFFTPRRFPHVSPRSCITEIPVVRFMATPVVALPLLSSGCPLSPPPTSRCCFIFIFPFPPKARRVPQITCFPFYKIKRFVNYSIKSSIVIRESFYPNNLLVVLLNPKPFGFVDNNFRDTSRYFASERLRIKFVFLTDLHLQ